MPPPPFPRSAPANFNGVRRPVRGFGNRASKIDRAIIDPLAISERGEMIHGATWKPADLACRPPRKLPPDGCPSRQMLTATISYVQDAYSADSRPSDFHRLRRIIYTVLEAEWKLLEPSSRIDHVKWRNRPRLRTCFYTFEARYFLFYLGRSHDRNFLT